jgi:NTE family protein
MEAHSNNKIQEYLNAVDDQIKIAEGFKNSEKKFSDTYDHEGNQYVNLVLEGGAVLGLAHIGYTYILEKAGIRFWRLAGTSAGAINAVLLAAIGEKADAKSEKMLELFANKDFVEFVDGPSWLPDILKRAASNSGYILNLIIFYIGIFALTISNLIFLSIYHTPIYAKFVYFLLIVSLILILIIFSVWLLFKRLNWGINPGNEFYNWMNERLKDNKAGTTKELQNTAFQKADEFGLIFPVNEDVSFANADLNMITTDLTNKKKVTLPLESGNYGWNSDSQVADFVRCSMSIPFFFSPFIRHHNDKDTYFVDGGALSNFPINIFHNPKVKTPRLPVFGVMLDSLNVNEKSFSLINYLLDLIGTLKSYGDREFLDKNKFYEKHSIKVVNTSKFNSLNFSMSEDEKIKLFALGAKAAVEFLERFDWTQYKLDREANYSKYHKI